MPRSERFSSLFENRWNTGERLPVEVLNLSRRGYSTDQEAMVLQNDGLNLQPDLIWLSYVLNDPAHPVYHDANGQLGRYFHRPRWRGAHYLRKKVFDVRESFASGACPTEFHQLLHCVYRDRIVERLRTIRTLADDIPILVSIHPVFVQGATFPDYPHENIHSDLAAIAADLDMTVIDLVPAYRGHAAEALNLNLSEEWFDPWHLNPYGHQLTAEYLVGEFEKRGVLEFEAGSG